MVKKTNFDWIIEKLADIKGVDSTSIINENLLSIVRKEGPSLTVTTSSLDVFGVLDIRTILGTNDADFILHKTREVYIHGEVFDYLNGEQKVLGGYGDLFRVVGQDYNWPYLPPEVKFIVRGLEQHTRVTQVRRLDNKRYEIIRNGLETVIIIALYDYELGIESIREALSKYKSFDAVLKGNPNGGISTNGLELADARLIKVFRWGELLGKLNQRWNWKA